MQHYWGQAQIMARIGYAPSTRVPIVIHRDGLPVFKRRDPKRPFQAMYYASEAMILAWELSRAAIHASQTTHRQVERQE